MGSYDDLGSGIRVRNGSICKSVVVGIVVLAFSLLWIGAASFVVYSVYNATYMQTITIDGDDRTVRLRRCWFRARSCADTYSLVFACLLSCS